MSEWFDNQKKPNSDFRKLLEERINKANLRRKLLAEETKRLAKLEAIANKLTRGENVQNRQMQTWLREDEYAQVDIEWQEQLRNFLQIGNTSLSSSGTMAFYKILLAMGTQYSHQTYNQT